MVMNYINQYLNIVNLFYLLNRVWPTRRDHFWTDDNPGILQIGTRGPQSRPPGDIFQQYLADVTGCILGSPRIRSKRKISIMLLSYEIASIGSLIMGLLSFLKIRGVISPENNTHIGPEEGKQKIQRIIEVIIILLLATATVSSAWCIYEASAWGNVQMENVGAIALLQGESIRLTDDDNMLRTIDVNLFLSWVQAASENQTGRMVFLEERFRDEFQPAFNEWLGNRKPGEVPTGTPFSLRSYSLKTTLELDQLKVNMSEHLDSVRQANQNSDRYILTTVFGALVLFFAGVAGKWKWPAITIIFIGIAMIFLVITLQRVFTLPVILN